MSSLNLYDRRFIIFTGKGGVGKTTMASAYALSCAQRGERTLLMELNVKDKVSSMFGAEDVGSEIVEVEENLFAVNVTPEAALEEYALMILRVKLIYRAVFENRIVRSFLRVVPGINELLMLGKAYYHATEKDENGKLVWDKIILDAPATGHGIFFLQIPSVITSLVSSGLMFEEAQRIEDLLRNPKSSAVVLVCLAEEMPVNETLMLRDVLRDEFRMPIGCVIANALYRPLFEAEENDWIEAIAASPDALDCSEIPGMLDAARFRATRVAMQQTYLERLQSEANLPIVRVPYYFMERMSFAAIREIANDLEGQLQDTDAVRSAG